MWKAWNEAKVTCGCSHTHTYITPFSCREDLLVMTGGAPLDEVDGYSVTISDHDNVMTLQLTSGVRGMHVLENTQADRDSGIVGQDAENSVTGPSMGRVCHLGDTYRHACIGSIWTALACNSILGFLFVFFCNCVLLSNYRFSAW